MHVRRTFLASFFLSRFAFALNWSRDSFALGAAATPFEVGAAAGAGAGAGAGAVSAAAAAWRRVWSEKRDELRQCAGLLEHLGMDGTDAPGAPYCTRNRSDPRHGRGEATGLVRFRRPRAVCQLAPFAMPRDKDADDLAEIEAFIATADAAAAKPTGVPGAGRKKKAPVAAPQRVTAKFLSGGAGSSKAAAVSAAVAGPSSAAAAATAPSIIDQFLEDKAAADQEAAARAALVESVRAAVRGADEDDDEGGRARRVDGDATVRVSPSLAGKHPFGGVCFTRKATLTVSSSPASPCRLCLSTRTKYWRTWAATWAAALARISWKNPVQLSDPFHRRQLLSYASLSRTAAKLQPQCSALRQTCLAPTRSSQTC